MAGWRNINMVLAKGEQDEEVGTGQGFGRIVLILAGVSGLIATLLTLMCVSPSQLHPPYSYLRLQFHLSAIQELPQAPSPAPCHSYPRHGAHLLRSFVGITHLPPSLLLDRALSRCLRSLHHLHLLPATHQLYRRRKKPDHHDAWSPTRTTPLAHESRFRQGRH